MCAEDNHKCGGFDGVRFLGNLPSMETTTSCLKRDVRRVSCQIWFCVLLCFYSVIHPVSQKVLLHSFFEVSFANECNLVRAAAVSTHQPAGLPRKLETDRSRCRWTSRIFDDVFIPDTEFHV